MSIHQLRPPGVIDVVEAGEWERLPASLAQIDGHRSGAVIGQLVVPGSTVVGHHALRDVEPRHWPLVFAMALPDSPPRFVTVDCRWPDGLPEGRNGGLALAEAVRDGINRAFPPRRPDLIPMVAVVGEATVALVWTGAVQARATVGPVLDNPGFDLLARPGTHPSASHGSEVVTTGPPGPPGLALVAGGAALAMSVAGHSPIMAVAAVFLCGIGLAGIAN